MIKNSGHKGAETHTLRAGSRLNSTPQKVVRASVNPSPCSINTTQLSGTWVSPITASSTFTHTSPRLWQAGVPQPAGRDSQRPFVCLAEDTSNIWEAQILIIRRQAESQTALPSSPHCLWSTRCAATGPCPRVLLEPFTSGKMPHNSGQGQQGFRIVSHRDLPEGAGSEGGCARADGPGSPAPELPLNSSPVTSC